MRKMGKQGNTVTDSPRKTVQPGQMALDVVETGDGAKSSFGAADRVGKKLPPGVNSKMIYKDVVRIAWPSLIELTLTQLTSMVDLMMVGGLGAAAISAVGLTNQPKFLLMTMFQAMNVGATALVARYRGAGEQERANTILRQALVLSLTLSTIASILGYAFAEQFISFMGAADEATLSGGVTYLRIQMMGFVPFALTTTATATLRGVGNTRIAMTYNLIANVANVILNYLLIHGYYGFPRLELAGASLATILGQGVAFVIAMIVLLRGKHYLHLRVRGGFKPIWKDIKSITNVGLPAMIEQLLMRTGMITFVKIVASLGTVAFATHNISMNIQALSFMSGQAFAVSATSLVGQSLGKKRPDMAQAYSNHTRHIGMTFALFVGFGFFFFGKNVIGLYTDDPAIIAQGAVILKLMAITQPFQSSQFILAGALRGAGDTRATAVISFFTVMLLRPSLAALNINVLGWGLLGAWIAIVVDQVVRSGLVLWRYNSGKWKTIRI